MRIVSVAQMRELERQTFAAGVSEAELQQRAGRAVAEAVARLRPGAGRVLALVGTGNNGRDSWIATQRLGERGWRPCLYLCPGHSIAEGELRAFARGGGEIVRHSDAAGTSALETVLQEADVALDGLLGIGARGEPREPLPSIMLTLNAARERNPQMLVVAVDTPTGVDADTGRALGAAVEADATVVLGGAKRGLLTPGAARFTGLLIHADIGILDGPEDAPQVVTPASVRGLLAARPLDAHKGTFGRLLVVAGSERYVGAAFLVGAAAARAGAGIVTLAAPPWLRDVVAARLPEVIYLVLPEGGVVGEPDECIRRIIQGLGAFDAMAIGPGLSTEGGAGAVVEAVLRERARVGIPAVVDADGLNALAACPDWPQWIGPGAVMTPHGGELRRLLSEDVDAAEAPWNVVQRLSGQWGVTVVLKGPFTAVGSEGCSWVHPRPNPGLATAGTGDVLTGLIAGLLARGLTPGDAARLGVWAHGAAGARAGQGRAAGGLVASDLLLAIPEALAETVGDRSWRAER